MRKTRHTGICLTLLLASCYSEDPQRYIEEGKVLFDKGEWESARVQFQNALQLDPKLSDVYFRLALLDEQKQNWAGMLSNLMETISIDPKHFEGQLKLGQIYLLGGQSDKAADSAKTVLQLNPESPTALLLHASVLLRQGRHNEAMQAVERVLAKQPFLPEAAGLQANILAEDKRLDAALSVLESAIQHHPAHIDLRLLKIRLEVEGQHFDSAVRHYQDLIAEHPEDADLQVSLANLLRDVGREDEAESILRGTINQHPEENELKLNLVDWLEQNHAERTEQTLQAFIQQAPKSALLKFRLAEYYLKHGRLSDAENQFQVIADSDSEGADRLIAKVKLAEISQLQHDSEKAASLVEQVLSIDPHNSDGLLLRAGMRLNKQAADGAIADLRIVLRDRPNSEKAMLLLAQANLLKGQTEVAESQWRKILEINPSNMVAIVAFSNELLKRGDYGRAEELSVKAAKANPSDRAPVEMLIRLKAARKDWQGAKNAVQQLKAIPQLSKSAKYWEGFLAAQQGRGDEAIQAFQEELALQPEQSQALLALSQIYEGTGRRAELIAYLKNFSDKNPGVPQAQLLLANAYREDKNWAAAESSLRKASDNVPHDIEIKLQWLDVIERQSEARTEETLKAWLQTDPNQMRLKFRLANFYADRQRYADAVPVLQEVVGFDPLGREGLAAKLKLAEVAWVQKDSKMADTLLAEVIAEKPLKNEALLLRASMRIAQKNAAEAIPDLQQLLKNQPNFEPALRMLVEVYQNSANQNELIAFLKSVLQDNPHADTVYPVLAAAYAKDSNWPEAEKLLQDKLKRTPGDVDAYVLLARVFAEQGKDAEVEMTYQNGLAAVGSSRQLMGERAKFFLYKKDFEKAVAAYEALVTKFPTDDEAANNLATLLVTRQAHDNTSIARAEALVERFKYATNPSVQDTFGWVHLKAGNMRTALAVLKKASTAAPKEPSIRYHLAEAYRLHGDTQAAIAELEKSLSLAADQVSFPEIDAAKILLNQLKSH